MLMQWRVAARFGVALLACLLARGALAGGPGQPVPDAQACTQAIAGADRAGRLPADMLGAIGVVESGRRDPATGAVRPWPWSIDVAGSDAVFASKAEAIAAVQAAQRAGIRSIDVGCMQINLLHHPDAFASLDEAFDPGANVRYAIGFLLDLRAQTGSWAAAVADYHSATPGIGDAYALRVAESWPLAERYGLDARLLTARVAMSGLAFNPVDAIDPGRLLTPAFRAERIAAADFAHGSIGPVRLALGVAPLRGRTSLAAMEQKVDPTNLLTPAFRRERAEAALAQLNAAARNGAAPSRVGTATARTKIWRVASLGD
jgi:hypothetical protein